MSAVFLTELDGYDMVIGANDGIAFDPAWFFEYWQNVPKHTVVWVEPIPALFERLTENTKNIKNRQLINKAAKAGNSPMTHLELSCWNLTEIDNSLKTGVSPFPKEVRKPAEYWRALCGLDVNGLEISANIYETSEYKALSNERKEEVHDEVRRHIVKYRPEAKSPKELIDLVRVKDGTPKKMRYLQIDVEFLDNQIIASLPFDENFHPDLILYENHHGDKVQPWLEENGYYWCCCLKQWGSNCVAVHKDTETHTNTTAPKTMLQV